MINLGDKVKDMVSGFRGIATARYTFLQGCSRICIQPPIDDKGKLPETQTFDEPLIEVIEVQKVKPVIEKEYPGGPDKYPNSGRSSG